MNLFVGASLFFGIPGGAALALAFVLGLVTLYAIPKSRDEVKEYMSTLGGLFPVSFAAVTLGMLWLYAIALLWNLFSN